MAYVIAEPCIGTKDNSCVEVCPVDCIHPTPDEPDYDKVEMLFIDPEECIDCDACVEACPVDACFAEDQLPDEWASSPSATRRTSPASSRLRPHPARCRSDSMSSTVIARRSVVTQLSPRRVCSALLTPSREEPTQLASSSCVIGRSISTPPPGCGLP